MKRNALLLLIFCLLFAVADVALACRYSGTSPIVLNGYMARGYGQVSFVLALGTLYLQLRRAGLNKSSLFWAASFVPIYFFNPGWHYNGRSGDCGYGERAEAYQMMYYIGAMLLWQIGATLWFIWRHHVGRQE